MSGQDVWAGCLGVRCLLVLLRGILLIGIIRALLADEVSACLHEASLLTLHSGRAPAGPVVCSLKQLQHRYHQNDTHDARGMDIEQGKMPQER
jgi:hypothetical protein